MEKYSEPKAIIILYEEQDVIRVSNGDSFEGDDFPQLVQ